MPIANAKAPAHISSLPNMGKCPGMMLGMIQDDTPGGPAAQAGSAVGRAIELLHSGWTLQDSLRRVADEAPEQGWTGLDSKDWENITGWATAYHNDERNKGVVVEGSCELEVKLELPPAPEDPSGEPVCFLGHVDQVREHADGTLRVWDVKSGRAGGQELLCVHAWQLSAYALGCTETYGRPVLPGGIIRLRSYTTKRKADDADGKPQPVFIAASWDLDGARKHMETVVQHIAWLRQGLVHLHPGAHCQWCPWVDPGTCASRIRSIPDFRKRSRKAVSQCPVSP